MIPGRPLRPAQLAERQPVRPFSGREVGLKCGRSCRPSRSLARLRFVSMVSVLMPSASTPQRRLALAVSAALVASLLPSTLHAQHKLGAQGSFVAPKVAAASDEGEKNLKRFQLPPGWKGELWAAEPDVSQPVAFNVADDGRVYVAESFRAWRGVPDIRGIMPWLDEDLACKSVEDRLDMMKRHLGETGMKDYYLNTERVRVLWDSNGDGKADVSKVFAENFATPLDGVASGVLARGKDVYFANIPNIWHLRDDNYDGLADSRRSISYGHGIRVGFLGHDLHGLVWGPEGKLYFSIGDRASMLQTEGHLVGNPDCGGVFRCNPDGTEMEMVYQGLRNPQQLVFDEWGDLFTGDNNSDGGDQARWTYLIEGGDSGWRIGWQFLEPGNAPNPRGPWNSEKMWHPQNDTQPAYLTPPIRNITAGPSGVAYYPGTGLGPEWQGTYTLCDFRGSGSGSGIMSFKLKPKGASFEVVEDKKHIWAIEATDGFWGPDGAYWVSDWVDGWEPVGKGRIYRFFDPVKIQAPIVRETSTLLKAGFAQRTPAELAKLLGHANYRVRQGAQYELASRGETSTSRLVSVAKAGPTVQARLHAIWALGQVAHATAATKNGAKSEPLEALIPLLADKEPRVRGNVARVLGDARYLRAQDALARQTTDADAHAQALASIALGKLGQRSAVPVLLSVLRDNADADPHVRHAAVFGLSRCADVDDLLAVAGDANDSVRMGVLLTLRKLQRNEISRFVTDANPKLVLEAARAISDVPINGAMENLARLITQPIAGDPLVRRVLNANLRHGTTNTALALATFATKDGASEANRSEALAMLAAWPKNAGRDWVSGLWRPTTFARDAKVPAAALAPVVNVLLASAPDAVQAAAAKAAGQLHLTGASAALHKLVTQATVVAPTRIAALTALSELQTPEYATALALALKDDRESLRKAALKLSVEAPPVAGVSGAAPTAADPTDRLAAVIASGTLSEKQNAYATLTGVAGSRADAVIGQALTDLLAGKVPAELRVDILEAAAKRPALKADLAKYEATLDPKDDLARWRPVLAGGNAELGQKVFAEKAEVSCVRCHKAAGEGGEVGPELTGIITRQNREYLLQSIVHPNATIAQGFENLLVTLKNGTSYAGIIKADTADTLVINSPEDGELKLKKADIVTREKGLSGMPEGLADQLTKFELRNLIEYIATLK